jgi:hypothetical protein
MASLSKHIIDVLEEVRDGHMIAKLSEDIARLENELDVAPRVPPSHDPKKRESNLLKIIGGFVQIVYLQNESGKFWKGEKCDQPNISAIAEAVREALSIAGYSDEGFKDRTLRNIITDALERIKENKKS